MVRFFYFISFLLFFFLFAFVLNRSNCNFKMIFFPICHMADSFFSATNWQVITFDKSTAMSSAFNSFEKRKWANHDPLVWCCIFSKYTHRCHSLLNIVQFYATVVVVIQFLLNRLTFKLVSFFFLICFVSFHFVFDTFLVFCFIVRCIWGGH